jgi:hypothetical protein
MFVMVHVHTKCRDKTRNGLIDIISKTIEHVFGYKETEILSVR